MPQRNQAQLGVLLLGLFGALGCSPTYNWRELRLDGAPLQAMLPCKPETATRPVPLLGPGAPEVVLGMQACEAGGVRFALAWAELRNPLETDAALRAWRSASLAAVHVPAAAAEAPTEQWLPQVVGSVAGAPPALGVDVQGQDAQRQPVRMRVAWFAHGRYVFQAGVYGARLSDDATEPFFSGLRLLAP